MTEPIEDLLEPEQEIPYYFDRGLYRRMISGGMSPQAAFDLTQKVSAEIMETQIRRGPQGEQGPPGPEGPVGPVGPVGPLGPVGDVGPVGPQGIQGVMGPEGPQGALGPPGPVGPVGPEGAAGTQGPEGLQGIQGPAGPIGASGLNFLGTWDPTIDYAPNDVVFYDGSTWFADADPPIGDPVSSANWHPLSMMGQQGPQGVPGVEGPQGVQGIQGLTGPIGPIGPQGPQGLVGPEGPQGGLGTTGLTGPPGPQGPTGPQGPQGPKGDTGATGPQGAAGTNAVGSMIYKGDWMPGASYNKDDITHFEDMKLLCIVAHGPTGEYAPRLDEHWIVLSQEFHGKIVQGAISFSGHISAIPAPSAETYGWTALVQQTGMADAYWVCSRSALGAFRWYPITLGPAAL